VKLFKGDRELARAAEERSVALVRRAAAVCLAYPDEAFAERLELVRDTCPELPSAFGEFCGFVASQDPYELASAYVATFDQKNRNSLYLTWWTTGDTRNRGNALVAFIQAYRECGFEYTGEELPDHLTVVLEFASSSSLEAVRTGTALLTGHYGALLKLHKSLGASPYAPVLAAVIATVPEPMEDAIREEALAAARFTPIPLAYGDSR
jgi:nitrate reductase molybdenum cofactor assembly chaperone NarJ/NarW